MRAACPEALLVHRLDRDTSGVMVFARTRLAQRHLGWQFERRQVAKTYVARVEGTVVAGEAGRIDLPLICDWPNRPRQMVCHARGKPAVTDWRVVGREAGATRLELRPLTGRSHQLRVHLAALGHPILGDPFYGRCRRGRPAAAPRGADRVSPSGRRRPGSSSRAGAVLRGIDAHGRKACSAAGHRTGAGRQLSRLDPGRGRAARAARLGAQRAADGSVAGAARRAETRAGGARCSRRCGAGRRRRASDGPVSRAGRRSAAPPARIRARGLARFRAAGSASEPGGAADAGAVAVDVRHQAGVELVAEDMRLDQARARSRRGGRRWRGRRRGR